MNLSPQLQAVLRSDLQAFTEKCLSSLKPGRPFLSNWHIEAMADRLEAVRQGKVRRLIINVPPRSLKSVLTTVAFSAFMLGHDPGARIITVSYGQDLALKHARDTKRIMEASWYQELFPATIITKSTEALLETDRGGSRFATSIGGTLTGLGAHLIIIDDPLKPDEAMSKSARDRVNRFFGETLVSRLESKAESSIAIAMQRLHEDDLVGHLLRNGAADWEQLVLPAVSPADMTVALGTNAAGQRRHKVIKAGDVLHPEREPLAVLEELKREMGSAAYAAQYLQSPVPASGLMVKPEWLDRYTHVPPHEAGRVIQSWDTALKNDSRADYSVCTTWLEVGTDHYLLDVFRMKVDFPDLLRCLRNEESKHRPDSILIEDKGSGTSLIQTLRAGSGARPVAIQTKDDKVTRLNRVLPMIEAGQVHFPQDKPWLADLFHELLGFPNARHDDQVDSVSQYLSWTRDRVIFEYSFI